MSLYPSLEDMKVDHMIQAQNPVAVPPPTIPSNPAHLPYPVHPVYPTMPVPPQATPTGQPYQALSSPSAPPTGSAYPGLQEYMGMELSQDVIAANMPEYLPSATNQSVTLTATHGGVSTYGGAPATYGRGMIAPLTASSPGLARAQVSHGVRQVVLCKDGEGKIGLRVKAINKGIFVCLVKKDSPAALGGLRFGDQILQINGENVAGFSTEKVHDILKKTGVNNITMAVRDRPFERTLTLHKDSSGNIGFQFKDGRITSITVDSSAARNGLLIEHNLLEVNGQNVVGVKDKEIGQVIDEGGNVITVTIIPTYMFNHIVKNMSSSLVKKMMDHSIPDL